jgi:hypothetical protein
MRYLFEAIDAFFFFLRDNYNATTTKIDENAKKNIN